jgi:hypothetical protein
MVHLVSLLGRKKDGRSEFFYYPFRSGYETDSTDPTFQQWLDERYPGRFVVHEFPTTDGQGVPRERLLEIANRVRHLLRTEKVVVVIDSAGSERTARVGE